MEVLLAGVYRIPHDLLFDLNGAMVDPIHATQNGGFLQRLGGITRINMRTHSLKSKS